MLVEGEEDHVLEVFVSSGIPHLLKGLLLFHVSHTVENLVVQEFESAHAEVGIQIEHVGEEFEDIFVFGVELLAKLFAYGRQILFFRGRVVANLKFVAVGNGLIAAQKAEVVVRLRPQLLSDHVELISLGDRPCSLFCSLGLLLAWRKWKARFSPEQVAIPGKSIVIEVPIFECVLYDLVDNAAHAPQVGCLVILFFNYGDLRCAIPSGSHVNRNGPFLLVSSQAIPVEQFRYVRIRLRFRLHPFGSDALASYFLPHEIPDLLRVHV